MCGYVVIMIHTFDSDTPAYYFKEYDRAVKYLQKLWEDYYNEEIANGSWLIESECYHEDEYALVTWADGCQTQFILTYLSEPEECDEIKIHRGS